MRWLVTLHLPSGSRNECWCSVGFLMKRKYSVQTPNPRHGATHIEACLLSSCTSLERPPQVYKDVCLLGDSNLTMKHHTQDHLSSLHRGKAHVCGSNECLQSDDFHVTRVAHMLSLVLDHHMNAPISHHLSNTAHSASSLQQGPEEPGPQTGWMATMWNVYPAGM